MISSATFFDYVSNIVSIVILRLQKFAQATMHAKQVIAMPPYVQEAKINEWRYFLYTMLNVSMLGAILLSFIHFRLQAGIGIAVSLVPKERNALIANNVIAEARGGAVVGTEYGKPVTGDLTKGPDARAAGVRVENNAVS